MSWPCQQCGQYHEPSTVCPLPPFDPEATEGMTVGNATLNGLTFGEQLIAEKLDTIIVLLQALEAQGRKI